MTTRTAIPKRLTTAFVRFFVTTGPLVQFWEDYIIAGLSENQSHEILGPASDQHAAAPVIAQ